MIKIAERILEIFVIILFCIVVVGAVGIIICGVAYVMPPMVINMSESFNGEPGEVIINISEIEITPQYDLLRTTENEEYSVYKSRFRPLFKLGGVYTVTLYDSYEEGKRNEIRSVIIKKNIVNTTGGYRNGYSS